MSAGSARKPTAITTAPSGTLIAKIAGQPSVWVSTPPSSAPEEAPSPPTAAHRPRPRLRSGPSGSAEVMIERVAGATIAPPKPCRARAAISSVRESATAHASDDRVNSATPTRNTRRRPNRSAERPPSIRNPANVSV